MQCSTMQNSTLKNWSEFTADYSNNNNNNNNNLVGEPGWISNFAPLKTRGKLL